jgi:hypothetical protein
MKNKICHLLILFFIISCSSKEQEPILVQEPVPVNNSSQPIPGGKSYYTVVYGHMTNTIADPVVWSRLATINFDGPKGTFTESFCSWSSDLMKGKALLPICNHTCTVDGITGDVNIYTPTGWGTPTVKTGTYIYDSSTKSITMTWPDGKTEQWKVYTVVDAGLAKLELVSSSYGITHGVGYGSNSNWSVYKKITEVPRIYFHGKSVIASYAAGGRTNSEWVNSDWNLANFSLEMAQDTLLFYRQPAAAPCDSPNNTTERKGIVYHVGSNHNRSMIINQWCANLCVAPNYNFPNYTGNMHPYAVQQIINDNGDLKGFLIIEEQNPPQASYNGYFQYQIIERLDNNYTLN